MLRAVRWPIPGSNPSSTWAGNHRHPHANPLQEIGFFPQIGGVAGDHGGLAPVEHPVTGGAVADSLPRQRRLSGQRRAGHRAGRQDHPLAFHSVSPSPTRNLSSKGSTDTTRAG